MALTPLPVFSFLTVCQRGFRTATEAAVARAASGITISGSGWFVARFHFACCRVIEKGKQTFLDAGDDSDASYEDAPEPVRFAIQL